MRERDLWRQTAIRYETCDVSLLVDLYGIDILSPYSILPKTIVDYGIVRKLDFFKSMSSMGVVPFRLAAQRLGMTDESFGGLISIQPCYNDADTSVVLENTVLELLNLSVMDFSKSDYTKLHVVIRKTFRVNVSPVWCHSCPITTNDRQYGTRIDAITLRPICNKCAVKTGTGLKDSFWYEDVAHPSSLWENDRKT